MGDDKKPTSGFWIIVAEKQVLYVSIVACMLFLAMGFFIGHHLTVSENKNTAGKTANSGKKTLWTCSMHPQVRKSEPGKCPICFMDLIPVEDDGEVLGPRMISMSEEAKRLAEVETVPAARKFVDVNIPLAGMVDYAETRIKTISAWVPGRLDRMFVDYTGVPVKKGDHLVEMYSPELFSGQEELLQAIKAVRNLKDSASEIVRRSTEKTVESAREKLRLLGLSPEQIRKVEERGTSSATVQINAPASGIVIHKNANAGDYVKTGTPIYTVADLSKVWVKLDAYESDIAWLRYGQKVEIKTEAYGDRVFNGWISFIDPVLNPMTRTIKIRVVVDNPDGMLRPNMFVRAVVKVKVADGGMVVGGGLSGKWISPMHPEVVKDGPGKCDVCGMDLVKAEEMGYVSESEAKPPLVVPASAVLTTGERAIVYVRVPGKDRPTFEGVEVKIGSRAGDYYIINSGLKEGQEVVRQGNFKIDAALQLLAKPSMMNPEKSDPAAMNHSGGEKMKMSMPEWKPDEGANRGEVKRIGAPEIFLKQLSPLYDSYLAAQVALAADDSAQAGKALEQLSESLNKVDMTLLEGEAHMQWMELSRQIAKAIEHRKHAAGIADVRTIFRNLSMAMINLEKLFGHYGTAKHRIAFCPMANDGKGAEWLQTGETVSNPYYGAAMLRCGEIRETFPKVTADGGNDE
ncbi:MAG: efflux RND transporter periplasmic adaptor subunit [Planctomycetes bacterium]|nr:efflux RND transporter periplasmic adaptor subunit [Planctomycetota bacterium]